MNPIPVRAAWCVLVAILLPFPVWAAEPLSLSAAIESALGGNPRLAATVARAEALAEMPERLGSRPDPRLQLNAMNLPVDTFALGQEPMTQLQIGIGQLLPFPGKLPLRREAADLDAKAARTDVGETRHQVVQDVTIAWWRLLYLDRALEIVRNNQELLRQFVTIARTKYTVGKGLQQDVLLAEVELSKLFDERLALEVKRAESAAKLARLMGTDTDAIQVLGGDIDVDLPEVAPVERLLEVAMARRPQLAGADYRAEAARSRLTLAKKDHLPDLMVSAAYGFRSGHNTNGSDRPDFASVMVGLNLPIDRNHRQDRFIAQRQRELLNRERLARSVKDRTVEAVSSAHARYRLTRERARLLANGIIPQAQQTVASMRAGYQVNKVDFLNLVRAQITLYNYETRYWKTLADAKGDLARLTAAVGASDVDAVIDADTRQTGGND